MNYKEENKKKIESKKTLKEGESVMETVVNQKAMLWMLIIIIIPSLTMAIYKSLKEGRCLYGTFVPTAALLSVIPNFLPILATKPILKTTLTVIPTILAVVLFALEVLYALNHK